MTPTYYFDPKTNTLHGPIDRMPPGKHAVNHNDKCLCDVCIRDMAISKAFNDYLQTLPSIPHAFSGPSRVVPEGEIEWKYCNCKVGNDCPYRKGKWFSPCRVATPKITEEGKKSNRFPWEKDMKDGETCVPSNEDLYALEGEPDTQAPGYTSTSGEDGDYPGYQCGLSEFEWQMEKVIDEIRSKETTLECMAPLVKFLRSQQPPLPAQPDRTHRYEYSNISEYLECYGDYVLRGTWNLPADFIAVNPPPSPTPQQGDTGNADNSMFTKDQREYVDSVPEDQLRSHLLHQVRLRDNMEKDRDRLLQQPALLPALTTDEEAGELYALEAAKACQSRTFTMSDTEYEKLHERSFLAGCTHVRSQQTNLKTDKP